MMSMKKNNILLKDCCEIKAGGDKPKNFSKSKTDICTIPVYANGIDNKGLVGFTDKAQILQKAITISARGSTGAAFYRDKPYVPIIRLISIIPNELIVDSKYLYYVLDNMNIKGIGSVQAQLTVPDIEKRSICIFEDCDYQRKVADVLSSIDTQIQRNEYMVHKLRLNDTTISCFSTKGEMRHVA